MKSGLAGRLTLFLVVMVVGTTVDLLTKSWIFAKLGMPHTSEPIWVVPKVFSLTTSLNEGALFGMGQGMVTWFAALSVVAALAIIAWVIWGKAAHDWVLCGALGAIMGGIFGNLYDRLGMPGLKWDDPARYGETVRAVRDWLHFKIDGVIDWPVFNIADCLLVVGAALLFIHAWHTDLAERRAARASLREPRSAQ
jgi:signal peptidase II